MGKKYGPLAAQSYIQKNLKGTSEPAADVRRMGLVVAVTMIGAAVSTTTTGC